MASLSIGKNNDFCPLTGKSRTELVRNDDLFQLDSNTSDTKQIYSILALFDLYFKPQEVKGTGEYPLHLPNGQKFLADDLARLYAQYVIRYDLIKNSKSVNSYPNACQQLNDYLARYRNKNTRQPNTSSQNVLGYHYIEKKYRENRTPMSRYSLREAKITKDWDTLRGERNYVLSSMRDNVGRELTQDEIKNGFPFGYQQGGAKYVKSNKIHVGRDGVKRCVYVRGNKTYVKKRDVKTGKMVYKAVRT